MKDIILSSRLQCIYDAAAGLAGSPGHGITLCDVGSDHAHVPLKLLINGIIEYAYCLDIIPGPLKIAADNVDRFGLTGKVDVILSDGLDGFSDRADILMITGMGGKMIADIMSRDPGKTALFNAVILSPQSFPELVRGTLRSLGFGITGESMIEENGKFYPVIIARNGSAGIKPSWERFIHGPDEQADTFLMQYAEDMYGPVLIARKDPVLYRYLIRGKAKTEAVLGVLDNGSKKDEFNKLLACIQSVLTEFGDHYETG